MSQMPTRPTLPIRVTWMADARRDLSDELCERLESELSNAFACLTRTDANVESLTKVNETDPNRDRGSTADALPLAAPQIIVKQRFAGYFSTPDSKVILAVEVQDQNGTRSSVVKIGDADQVGDDVKGWHSCAGRRGINSRLFIAPILREVGTNRVAVLYPDVYQYYYDNQRDDQPRELESIVEKSISHNSPTYTSVERVLTQVYTEAHRCLYRFAQEDLTHQRIEHAITRTLRLEKHDSIFLSWQQAPFVELRRSAAWLTCGNRKPESTEPPGYVDPVDYLQWAIKTRTFPVMLVGPAHGDLHGRNIIAGSVRGEAEWPAAFDFDKMQTTNIVAWDFAKLEIELKCLLFQTLLESAEDCKQICQWLAIPSRPPCPASIRLTGPESRIQQQAERMEIMLAIERLLLAWTRQLSTKGRAMRSEVQFVPEIPAESALGRALRIIFRIRREAAVYLGFERQGREHCWADEYLFALLSYGIGAVKWHSANDFLAWALLSSGVAAAELSHFPWPPTSNGPPAVEDSPTYLHLLPYAHACWQENKHYEPQQTMRSGIERFPYAVALRQQLALLLAQSGSMHDEETAREELESVSRLACVFRDHETLCRIGRVYKDRADRLLPAQTTHAEMIEQRLPSYQHFLSALQYYLTAYEVSESYYPAINAASLALLVGDHESKTRMANQVLDICGGLSTNREDQPWILASEGEASLLIGKPQQAVHFYRGSLDRIPTSSIGVVQSMYDQLCRLHWALGSEIVGPTIEMFDKQGRLKDLASGPFGNAGRG